MRAEKHVGHTFSSRSADLSWIAPVEFCFHVRCLSLRGTLRCTSSNTCTISCRNKREVSIELQVRHLSVHMNDFHATSSRKPALTLPFLPSLRIPRAQHGSTHCLWEMKASKKLNSAGSVVWEVTHDVRHHNEKCIKIMSWA